MSDCGHKSNSSCLLVKLLLPPPGFTSYMVIGCFIELHGLWCFPAPTRVGVMNVVSNCRHGPNDALWFLYFRRLIKGSASGLCKSGPRARCYVFKARIFYRLLFKLSYFEVGEFYQFRPLGIQGCQSGLLAISAHLKGYLRPRNKRTDEFILLLILISNKHVPLTFNHSSVGFGRQIETYCKCLSSRSSYGSYCTF